MKIKGMIHSIDIDAKIIGIKQYKRVVYFYFQNSQMNLFKRYLYKGILIELEYDEEKLFKKHRISAYLVSFIYKLESIAKYRKTIYYDKAYIGKSLSSFLKGLGNIMFLDLEMTMPGYNSKGKPFRTEMVQAGFIIVNSNGDELARYCNYITPTLSKNISKRTENFLKITDFEFQSKAISYKQFYDDFKEVLDEFNPVIMVYGRNDIIVLNDSYAINEVPSLKERTRFINLCQLIKSHYEFKNDPGLFKLHKLYYNDDDVQIHDAFNDSQVTLEVYKAFYNDVNKITNKAEVLRRELD